MALWGSNSAIANNAPKTGIIDRSDVRGNTAFGNTTVGAFRTNQAIGVFGVDTAETINAAANAVTHAGWVKVVQGVGSVANLVIVAGGSSYTNTDLIRVSGGTSNASGTLVTNSTGGITSVTITGAGAGFKSVATSTVAVTNSSGGTSAGSSATFTLTLGGRAGRVQMETLVAMGSINGDASDDTIFPDA